MVGEVADLAGVRARAEVLHEVAAAPTIASALNDHRRGGDPGHGAQRLGDRVHLGLVLAVGAEPLPEERDRVEPEHLDAEVGQEQDDLGELAQNTSGLAQLRSHCHSLNVVHTHPSSSASQVKLPGAKSGKTSGSVALVAVGQRAVGEDVEVVAVAPGRRPAPAAPTSCSRATWLSTRSRHEADPAARAAPSASVAQVVHGAEVGAHRAVVGDRVAAVVVALARLQQRHQVEVGDAELAQVVEVLGDAPQVAGEAVGVAA